MKKISEKSFNILKVCVFCVMVAVCGLYYLLFVDNVEEKTLVNEECTTANKQLANEIEDDFIIEIEPIDDYISSISETQLFCNSDENKNSSNDINETDSFKIDINNATIDELQTLKNIGPVVASNIISYRKEYGKFADIEDIKNVKGIGKAKYASIKDFIYVK